MGHGSMFSDPFSKTTHYTPRPIAGSELPLLLLDNYCIQREAYKCPTSFNVTVLLDGLHAICCTAREDRSNIKQQQISVTVQHKKKV